MSVDLIHGGEDVLKLVDLVADLLCDLSRPGRVDVLGSNEQEL